MCLILMGAGGSGKDTVKNSLVNKYGFHPIVTYTTRKPRAGEIDGVTYHFISETDFLEHVEREFFAEWKSYNVNGKNWYYGTSKADLIKASTKSVIILTPDGVRDIKKSGIDGVAIYLHSDLDTIKIRLKNRKDVNDKIKDRIERDSDLFESAISITDKVIQNLYTSDIDTIVDEVLYHYNRILKQKLNKRIYY